MQRSLATAILSVLLCAACAQEEPKAPPPSMALLVPPADHLPKRKPRQPAPLDTGTSAEETAVPVIGETPAPTFPAPGAATAALPPARGLESLVGLDFAETAARLGEPSSREERPPATIWTYNGQGCVIDLFFYPRLDGRTYRVLTYEVKTDQGIDPQNCTTGLMPEKTGSQTE